MARLKVAICGGGRTGHLTAVLFKRLPNISVALLTNNRAAIESHGRGNRFSALLPDGRTLSARLDAVSASPHEALADADIVIMTVPAHVRPALLSQIEPALPSDKPVYVGAIPGFCGFDWLAEKVLGHRRNVVIWGMKDVPHTAYDLEPGETVRMGGAKATLHVATHSREAIERRLDLLRVLQRVYCTPIVLLEDFLEITLTPGNPIMHSSVIYGLIGPYAQWHGKAFSEPLCWWTDCPELGAYFLERSDEENQRLCRAISEKLDIDLSSVKPLKEEIIDAYRDQIRDRHTMLSVLRTNQAYASIKAPLVPTEDGGGYLIDRQSRAFHEDIAFGLALLVEMGKRLSVRLPHIEEIFEWSVSYLGGLDASSLDYFPQDWPARRLSS